MSPSSYFNTTQTITNQRLFDQRSVHLEHSYSQTNVSTSTSLSRFFWYQIDEVWHIVILYSVIYHNTFTWLIQNPLLSRIDCIRSFLIVFCHICTVSGILGFDLDFCIGWSCLCCCWPCNKTSLVSRPIFSSKMTLFFSRWPLFSPSDHIALQKDHYFLHSNGNIPVLFRQCQFRQTVFDTESTIQTILKIGSRLTWRSQNSACK